LIYKVFYRFKKLAYRLQYFSQEGLNRRPTRLIATQVGRSIGMNTQRLAQLRISPLQLQQGLFASLALMITLIAAQQFHHWNQKQEVTQIQSLYRHSAPVAIATALKATDVGLSLKSIDEPAASDAQAPRQQSWVF
jgi:hypothetical protein